MDYWGLRLVSYIIIDDLCTLLSLQVLRSSTFSHTHTGESLGTRLASGCIDSGLLCHCTTAYLVYNTTGHTLQLTCEANTIPKGLSSEIVNLAEPYERECVTVM